MKRTAILIIVLLFAISGTAAQSAGKFGLLFDLSSLLGDIASSNDGYQGGVGVKWNASEKITARAILNFSADSDTGNNTSDNTFGLGISGQYHFIKAKVSPYLGAAAGIAASSTSEDGVTTADPLVFYIGALGGAEIKIIESIGLFFEYNLMAIFEDDNVLIRLGTDLLGPAAGKNIVLGLVVYF